jgi:cytochrome c2
MWRLISCTFSCALASTALRFVREDLMGQLFRSVVGLAIIATASSAPAQTADQIARGAKAFGEQKCSMCHAIAGKGKDGLVAYLQSLKAK